MIMDTYTHVQIWVYMYVCTYISMYTIYIDCGKTLVGEMKLYCNVVDNYVLCTFGFFFQFSFLLRMEVYL